MTDATTPDPALVRLLFPIIAAKLAHEVDADDNPIIGKLGKHRARATAEAVLIALQPALDAAREAGRLDGLAEAASFVDSEIDGHMDSHWIHENDTNAWVPSSPESEDHVIVLRSVADAIRTLTFAASAPGPAVQP